ncbi:Speriolin-like protein [Holothuria leucospilota]|uniref:Speriolin-like protein n=1 Tax=Holothuria leucospilota TaxID=206669 RepID=A0A9Q1BKN3_HOLLE|nr:Speriolin-like protein [Holothuria leucospilota]
MEATSKRLNTKTAIHTSGVRQLSEFIRRKKLVSDEHGKIILVDTENQDSVKLKKQIEFLQTQVISILSIDKSMYTSLKKLMEDWCMELQALEDADTNKMFHKVDSSGLEVHEQKVSELKMEDLGLTKNVTVTALTEPVKVRDGEKCDSLKRNDNETSVNGESTDDAFKNDKVLQITQSKQDFLKTTTENRWREGMSSLVSALDLAESESGTADIWNAKRVNTSSRYSTAPSAIKNKMQCKTTSISEKDPKYIPKVPVDILRNPSSYFKILNQAKTFRDLKRIVADFTRWQSSRQPYTRSSRAREVTAKSAYPDWVSPKSAINQGRDSGHRNDYLKAYNVLLASVPKTLNSDSSSGQLIGEIAFQLERRILAFVFKGERVTVEYTILNIEKMVHLHHVTKKETLFQRIKDVFQRLSCCGLKKRRHVSLIVGLIEAYGTYSHVDDARKLSKEKGWKNHRQLKYDLLQVTPTNLLHDVIVIVDCLIHLARADNKDVFLW